MTIDMLHIFFLFTDWDYLIYLAFELPLYKEFGLVSEDLTMFYAYFTCFYIPSDLILISICWIVQGLIRQRK